MQQVMTLLDGTAWIITSGTGSENGGLVATFVNNASLVPSLPRLVAGIARHHYTWELIHRSRVFAAHLVDEQQCELIWKFGLASGRDVNKFTDVKWHRGQTGSPVLDDALAWVDCSVEAELDIGDRSIYVGAVVDAGVTGISAPLTEKRIFELANAEQRHRMDEQRRRDERLDATALLTWRADTGSHRPQGFGRATD